MSDSSVKLNALSCRRCKDKKVRCNRHMPQCRTCQAHHAECEYPIRRKRRVNRSMQNNLNRLGGRALSDIIERLQKVEQQCDSLPPGSPPYADQRSPINARASIGCGRGSININPVALSTGSSPVTFNTSYSNGSQHTSSNPSSPFDSMSMLHDAMEQVEKLKLRSYSRALITEEIHIPKDVAKLWLKNFYSHLWIDSFVSLIDRKLIEMIPDLLEYPHIQIDASMIVIYYSILWHGGAITSMMGGEIKALRELTRPAFLACLRAVTLWQREATGTYTDMIAAIIVSRVAGDSFDSELAWRMHQHACEYAQALDLHKLDDRGGPIGIDCPLVTDDNRQGFWGLIQIDAFFRLIFKKPPWLTGNIWKVNLPGLNTSLENSRSLEQIVFLVSSRVALITLQFFSLMDEHRDNWEVLISKTELMCWDIINILDDWNLLQDAMKSHTPYFDILIIAEAAFTGYSTIIFMLRNDQGSDPSSPKLIRTHHDIRDCPVALTAARHFIRICLWVLEKCTHGVTLSWVFCMYRGYVPLAYMIRHLLQATNIMQYSEDVENISKVVRLVTQISEVEKELAPLAKTMQLLNEQVWERVHGIK